MRILRPSSIIVQQAMISTVVMLVAILLLGLAAILSVERQERINLTATIDADIAGLVDVMAQGGVGELQRRIADRTAFAATGNAAPYYRLSDDAGKLLAGNLGALPRLDARRSEVAIVGLPEDQLLVRATRLNSGLALYVGRSLTPTTVVLARLKWLFALGAIPAALLSLVTGPLLSARLERRVARINSTFVRFERGDLAARTDPQTTRDEIAKLGGHVDVHLANIAALLKSQREISDNIAHELRTPLVHLDSRLLRALDQSTDEAVDAELHDARDDIRSIVSLFDALLDLAMAESRGGIGSEMIDFDLSECAADLVELYSASAEDGGWKFSTRLAPGVTMRGEPMAMTRLLANLLDNAFKYVPTGGQVSLTVSPGPRILVEDNGPGIPAELQDHIFQRFQRARTGGHGHGLGLALVRVIAARHGLIAYHEDAHPGARFIVEEAARA